MSKDGTLGVCRVIDTQETFSIFVSVALIKNVKPFVDSYYLLRVLQSAFVQNQLITNSKGTGLKHIHLKELREVILPLPPLEEQLVISAAVENMIAKEEACIKLLNDNLNNQDRLSSSILNQAFKGSLGTNIRDEKNALHDMVVNDAMEQ